MGSYCFSLAGATQLSDSGNFHYDITLSDQYGDRKIINRLFSILGHILENAFSSFSEGLQNLSPLFGPSGPQITIEYAQFSPAE